MREWAHNLLKHNKTKDQIAQSNTHTQTIWDYSNFIHSYTSNNHNPMTTSNLMLYLQHSLIFLTSTLIKGVMEFVLQETQAITTPLIFYTP